MIVYLDNSVDTILLLTYFATLNTASDKNTWAFPLHNLKWEQ